VALEPLARVLPPALSKKPPFWARFLMTAVSSGGVPKRLGDVRALISSAAASMPGPP
jgi:hypothetical protein